MSLETIIEVGIGLIFAWLLLSMVVMYVQEWIVSRTELRASMLESTIRNMLADPGFAEQFYTHPLIKGLHSGENGESRPSYIPSGQFALALFDLVMNAGTEASLLQQEVFKLRSEIDLLQKDDKARAEAQYQLALTAVTNALSTQAGQDALNAALDNAKAQVVTIAEVSPALQPAVEQALANVKVNKSDVDAVLAQLQVQSSGLSETPALDQLRVGVAAMAVTQPQLAKALQSMLHGVEEYGGKAETGLAQARQNVETWFNDGMDRLSGWYKRNAQKLAYAIGIGVAIFMNGDTVALAQQLWRDPVVREALVVQAQDMVNNNTSAPQLSTDQLNQLKNQFNGLNIPFGWVGTPIALDSSGGIAGPDGEVSYTCTLSPNAATDVFGLAVAGQCYPVINAPHFNDLTGWVLKLIGLIISGIAAAQGAPFWFDILKKIINIRATGANPSETKAAG